LAGIIGNKSGEAYFERGGDVPEIEAATSDLTGVLRGEHRSAKSTYSAELAKA